MAIELSTTCNAFGTEILPSSAAGSPSVSLPHSISRSAINFSFEKAYSQGFPSVGNAGGAVSMDLSALTYTTYSVTVDLVTDQRITLIVIENVGPEAIIVAFESSVGIPITNGTTTIPSGGIHYRHQPGEHFMGEVLSHIDLSTASATSVVNVLLATESTL